MTFAVNQAGENSDLMRRQSLQSQTDLFADRLARLEDKPQTHSQQELFKELGQGLLEQIRNMSA